VKEGFDSSFVWKTSHKIVGFDPQESGYIHTQVGSIPTKSN
jgi:hypothetical protein